MSAECFSELTETATPGLIVGTIQARKHDILAEVSTKSDIAKLSTVQILELMVIAKFELVFASGWPNAENSSQLNADTMLQTIVRYGVRPSDRVTWNNQLVQAMCRGEELAFQIVGATKASIADFDSTLDIDMDERAAA